MGALLKTFEIHQACSIEEASALLGRYGESATAYAGGTELLLVMKRGLLHYPHLVDVKTIEELHRLELDGERQLLRIGACVTHHALTTSETVRRRLPVLAQVEHRVANIRVRATGTLGGNLCFADPHSDPGTLLMALGGEVVLQRGQAIRRLPMEAFFLDAYSTARAPDELLVCVEVPLPRPSTRVGYEKFQFHERPSVGVAVRLELDAGNQRVEEAVIVAGCVMPVPRRLPAAEAALRGASLAALEAALQEAAAAAAREVDATDDMEGSAEYKRHLTGVMLGRAARAALREELAQLAGSGRTA